MPRKRLEKTLHKAAFALLIAIFAIGLGVASLPAARRTSLPAARNTSSELLTKAMEYYQGRKYHECIVAFEKLRRHYRLNARFMAYLGFSYYKVQQYEEAVLCLEEGIPGLSAYSPKEQAVYLYACAESLFQLQRYAESLVYYSQALPLTTGNDAADVHYHMAFASFLLMPPDTLEAYNHFVLANEQYQASASQSPLDELHSARLAQTTAMLRALKQAVPSDSLQAVPSDSLTSLPLN